MNTVKTLPYREVKALLYNVIDLYGISFDDRILTSLWNVAKDKVDMREKAYKIQLQCGMEKLKPDALRVFAEKKGENGIGETAVPLSENFVNSIH